MKLIFAITATSLCSVVALAAETCGDTQAKFNEFMGGKVLIPNWIETTANDGKPLNILISTKDDRLFFTFDKTREGLWAEGCAQVCKDGKNLIVKISGKDIKLGDSAPLPIRLSMKSGANFDLRLDAPTKLHVSTFGWSGDFIPGAGPAKVVGSGSKP